MIQYTGQGSLYKATVVLFGDGVTAAININLAQAPFDVKFTNNIPVKTEAFVSKPVVASSGPPSESYVGDPTGQKNLKSIETVQGILRIAFNTSLPKVTAGKQERVRLDVYFLYEMQPITR